MKFAPIPQDEEKRLEQLKKYKVLDTFPEIIFDQITTLASQICGTKISLISLIDSDRQWFKSKHGLDAEETPRDISFCGHAIMSDEIFEISDSFLDDRFKDNPLVTGAPVVRFYAGVPLVANSGYKVGTLCVIDDHPKKLTSEQKAILKSLSNQVIAMFELRERDERLKNLSDKLSAIVNNIPIMLSSYDEKVGFEWVNKAWEDELGWSLEDMSGKNMLNEFYPDEAQREKALQFMMKPGTGWMDFKTRTKNNIYKNTSWSNIRLEDGKTVGIGIDVDHRIQAKLKIEQSNNELNLINQRFEHILQGAGLGSWDWWLTDNKVHFDSRWCEMLGLSADTTAQDFSTWETRVHPDDKERSFVEIKECLEGKNKQYENIHRLKHANGSWVWILARGAVSQRDSDGKPIRLTGTHLDMTKYKESEELLDNIQKMAKIGGWELDVITHNTLWTDETYHIHEVPVGTPTNTLSGISFFAKDEQEKISNYVQKCIEDGVSYCDIFEFIDAKGLRKWVKATGAPILGANGKVVKLRGILQDITELIKAEEATKIERAKVIQSAKLASLGEMAAGIAHEINNPLAIIDGTISLLPNYLNSPEKLNLKIESIHKAVERISKIVNGLRKFSRVSSPLNHQPQILEKIIKDALVLTDTKSKRHSVLVTFESTSSSEIKCDEIEIEQVIINLVNNGIDAVRSLPDKWVKIKLFDQDDHVVMQVHDSGPGITKDVARHLFQPFFTTKVVGEGTGLGLSITKGIVDEHHGSIEVLNGIKNTCFEIKFPKI